MNGEEIRKTRKLFKKTQEDFAELLGYKVRQWVSFESDKATPPDSVLLRLYEMRQQVEPTFLKDIYTKMEDLEKSFDAKIQVATKEIISHIASTYMLPNLEREIEVNQIKEKKVSKNKRA